MRLALVVVALLTGEARAEETAASLLATLHRAQDALVTEGEVARPVHDRLLKLLDERVARPHAEVPVADVVRYALSGGDPRIAARALAGVEQTARDAILVRGTLAYVSGRTREAGRLLGLIDPDRLRGRVAALVTLARAGTAARLGQHDDARRWLERVRLDAPGTLMEEAALRRLAADALERREADRFFRLARQYWHRFARSAFADRMQVLTRAAQLRFDEDALLEHLPRLARAMPEPAARAVTLDAARTALLEGRPRLARTTARRAGRGPRAVLFRSLLRLTEDGNTVASLDAVKSTELPPDDRRLLAAARGVGRAMLAPVVPRRGDGGAFTRGHRATLDAVDRLLMR